MAEAGADVLVPHMGLTTGGAIGADDGEDARRVRAADPGDARRRQARSTRTILVLCHGGPIAEPDDAAYVLERTEGVVGFFGASSMERLPTEVAMTENMKRFKSIPVIGARHEQRSGRREATRPRRARLGRLRPGAAARATGSPGSSRSRRRSCPGKCHDFHRHPGQEEVIYVLEGTIEQWLEQEKRDARGRATRS